MLTNQEKKFEYLVFIGRFQLFHNAHLTIVKKALEMAENVIIVIGSSFKPRTPKNPWSMPERKQMIMASLTDEEQGRVSFTWARDYLYNDSLWAKEVKRSVDTFIIKSNAKVGIIGHKKDETSFYLEFFPEWEFVEMGNQGEIHATQFRETYFTQGIMHLHADNLPVKTRSFLNAFFHKPEYLYVREWFETVKKIKEKWKTSPYEPTFITTDAVIFKSSHVLMVKRKAQPGKGLLALPGGYLGKNETIFNSMIRELKEETKIKLPVPVLEGHVKDQQVFDHPDRSDRGRIVTHAFLINLPPGPLEKVKGGDDAEKALWVPIEKLDNMTEQIFEDHYDIIKYFEGRV